MTRRPSSPGSSGMAQRSGWVVEKTNRPPGRSTRAASAITRAESATNGTTPYAVKTTSKVSSGKGRAAPSHCTRGTRSRGSVTVALIRRARSSMPADTSEATTAATP